MNSYQNDFFKIYVIERGVERIIASFSGSQRNFI